MIRSKMSPTNKLTERHEMRATVSGIHRFQSRKEKRETRRKCLPPNGWRIGEGKKRTRRATLPRMNFFRMAETNMAVRAHHRGIIEANKQGHRRCFRAGVRDR